MKSFMHEFGFVGCGSLRFGVYLPAVGIATWAARLPMQRFAGSVVGMNVMGRSRRIRRLPNVFESKGFER